MNTNRNADTTETAFLTPSVEAITEFSVETDGFKPNSGRPAAVLCRGGGAENGRYVHFQTALTLM